MNVLGVSGQKTQPKKRLNFKGRFFPKQGPNQGFPLSKLAQGNSNRLGTTEESRKSLRRRNPQNPERVPPPESQKSPKVTLRLCVVFRTFRLSIKFLRLTVRLMEID